MVSANELNKMYSFFIQRATQYPEHAGEIIAFCNKFLLKEMEVAQSGTTDNTSSLETKDSLDVVRTVIQSGKNTQSGSKTIFQTKNPFSLEKQKITRNRTGNGHKILKTRKLLDWERDYIRVCFVRLNGIIHEDDTLPIRKKLGMEVTPFQVTGFCSELHKYIREDLPIAPKLPDMPSYWAHRRKKQAA